MNPRIKGCLIIVIFLFAGMINGRGNGTNPLHLPVKSGIHANSRKFLGFDVVLDYDYAGANPKHNPRGRRGGGGRNL